MEKETTADPECMAAPPPTPALCQDGGVVPVPTPATQANDEPTPTPAGPSSAAPAESGSPPASPSSSIKSSGTKAKLNKMRSGLASVADRAVTADSRPDYGYIPKHGKKSPWEQRETVIDGEFIIPVYFIPTMCETVRDVLKPKDPDAPPKPKGEKWFIPLHSIWYKNCGDWCSYCCCQWCRLAEQRRRLLRNDPDNYICCQGKYGCLSRWLTSQFPGYSGVGMETCCCATHAMAANRAMVQKTYNLEDHGVDYVVVYGCKILCYIFDKVVCSLNIDPTAACKMAQIEYELRHRNFPKAPVQPPPPQTME